MAKLIPPKTVIRKTSDWGVKKWHFLSFDQNGVSKTTCNIVFPTDEIEVESIDNIDPDDICQKCLGAMTAIKSIA